MKMDQVEWENVHFRIYCEVVLGIFVSDTDQIDFIPL